jgi:hypothetical protein
MRNLTRTSAVTDRRLTMRATTRPRFVLLLTCTCRFQLALRSEQNPSGLEAHQIRPYRVGLCRSCGGQPPASSCRGRGSIPRNFLWYFGGYSDTGTGFSPVLQFSPVNVIPPVLHSNFIYMLLLPEGQTQEASDLPKSNALSGTWEHCLQKCCHCVIKQWLFVVRITRNKVFGPNDVSKPRIDRRQSNARCIFLRGRCTWRISRNCK